MPSMSLGQTSLFLSRKHCANGRHYSLGHFFWRLAWRVTGRTQDVAAWGVGAERGGVEGKKRNEETHETAERHGKHSKQHQRNIVSPWHCCFPPSLLVSKRSVLWRSLQETVGRQPGAGPGPSLQWDWSLPGVPLLGPAEHQHHLRQRGHGSAANKTSQTVELSGKLGAVTRHRCSSGHACTHLQSLRTLEFHLPVLPLQGAAPGYRLAPSGLETSECSLLTLTLCWLSKAQSSDWCNLPRPYRLPSNTAGGGWKISRALSVWVLT